MSHRSFHKMIFIKFPISTIIEQKEQYETQPQLVNQILFLVLIYIVRIFHQFETMKNSTSDSLVFLIVVTTHVVLLYSKSPSHFVTLLQRYLLTFKFIILELIHASTPDF